MSVAVELDMRSRNLAPGFWKNPELARCDAHARLMFAGLWGLADRSGRLEDRPEKIRADIFPFEGFLNADFLLWQLHDRGLALRYIARGRPLIEILGFTRYQRPYGHEPASIWPGLHDEGSTLRSPEISDGAIPDFPNGDKELRLSPVSCLLSPVSLLLAEEARNPSTQPRIPTAQPFSTPAVEYAQEGKRPEPPVPACYSELILALWREVLPTLPAPTVPWTSTPARYLRARWREQALHEGWQTAEDGLRWFRALFAYVDRSAFLTGRLKPNGSHAAPFEITLEWLVKHEHWAKVLQGQYHDGGRLP